MATYGSTNLGIILHNNPAAIAAGAYVSNIDAPKQIPVAIFGSSGVAWTIDNLGTVNAIGSQGTGIYLQSGGSITNGVGALIEASSLSVVIAGGPGQVINYGQISAGVVLKAGGAVGNSQGLIAGGFGGVEISGGYGAVNNGGTIAGTGVTSAGVYLMAGGTVANGQGALVSGVAEGIAIGGGAGAVANLGTVTASAATGLGVQLTGGGSIINGSAAAAGAQVSAANLGVAISGGPGSVVNYATISGFGAAGVGVYLTGGGYLNNTSTGLVEAGQQAVKITAGDATVVDYGTIIGGYGLVIEPGTAGSATVTVGGTIIGTTTVVSAGRTFQEAIQLVNGTDVLVLTPSADIIGNINGGGLGTLGLMAGAGTGTVAAFGTTVLGFGTVDVASGASWQLDGLAGSVRFTNDGTIVVAAGDALALGSVGEDAGAKGVIDAGGRVTFANTVAAGQRVVFTNRGASLVLDEASGFAAKIVHFRAGDTIDVVGAVVTGTYADGTLTLSDAKGRTVAALHLAGHHTTSQFGFSTDGQGGTLISLGPPARAADAGFAAASGSGVPMPEAASTASWWVMRS